MKTDLHRVVCRSIRSRVLLPAGGRVAVAVSGGADSVALLWLLHDLREELGIVLRVAHFNHQLRGRDADEDEGFVRALTARLGLECSVGCADVRAAAEKEGWNLEDAGRRLRRAFFEKLVAEGLVDRVAVAHTADDQAETVLMHLLRGTGLAGLGGIHPVADCVVRPLLDVRREELRAYLKARDETWRSDASNEDTSRMRARVRHHLLPQLAADYQATVVERLASLARLARQDESFFDALTDEAFDALAETTGESCSIDGDDLLAPLALKGGAPGSETALSGRLVRRMARAVRGECKRISAQHVEAVLEAARNAASGQRLELPGLVVEKRFGRLHFFTPKAGERQRTESEPNTYQYDVELPSASAPETTCHAAGAQLRLKGFDCPPQGSDTKCGAEASNVFDADLLRAPLVLRNWRPGDSYRPRGRRISHKLKRLFWEAGIPARERASWPVLISAERIVWTRQFGAAHEFSAGENTRRAVLVSEDKT